MSKERFDTIEGKLDRVLEHQGDMNVTISEIKVDVAHHIKRTTQLEGRMSVVERLVWMGAGAVAFVSALKAFGVF